MVCGVQPLVWLSVVGPPSTAMASLNLSDWDFLSAVDLLDN